MLLVFKGLQWTLPLVLYSNLITIVLIIKCYPVDNIIHCRVDMMIHWGHETALSSLADLCGDLKIKCHQWPPNCQTHWPPWSPHAKCPSCSVWPHYTPHFFMPFSLCFLDSTLSYSSPFLKRFMFNLFSWLYFLYLVPKWGIPQIRCMSSFPLYPSLGGHFHLYEFIITSKSRLWCPDS